MLNTTFREKTFANIEERIQKNNKKTENFTFLLKKDI
jgi:hypothetical protein